MTSRTWQRSARWQVLVALVLSVGFASACNDLLEVDLPAQLTDTALEDPAAAQTIINSIIGNYENAHNSYMWSAYGREEGGESRSTTGQDVARYPVEAGWFDNLSISRTFAADLHEKLEGWTEAQVPSKKRFLAISSLYAGASLTVMASALCEATVAGGPLLTPTQVTALAEQQLTQALTEIAAAGDFALPYGIASSAQAMAYGLRAQLRWMARDKAGALADAQRVPKGFFAWVKREPGVRQNTAYFEGTFSRRIALLDVYDTWTGTNPVTGQPWPRPLPFTGWWDLGILPDGRAVRDDGLPIRTAGLYRTPIEDTAVRDTRVKTVFGPIQASGEQAYVNARYAAEGDDLPLINWKEMWLIRAELEGGQTAIDLVNELRAADGLPAVTYITGATATPTQIKYLIFEERRRALFVEGRFFLTKLQNPDVLWFPRALGILPESPLGARRRRPLHHAEQRVHPQSQPGPRQARHGLLPARASYHQELIRLGETERGFNQHSKGAAMISRLIWLTSMVVCIGLGLATPAQAQVSWGFHAGVARPAGTFANYFDLGPTVGLEFARPMRDRLDLVLAADFDHYNGHSYFGLPNVNLWRFQVGVLADLVGAPSESWGIEAQVGAGGSSLRSQREFYLESSTFGVDLTPRTFAKTSVTGHGGLRLRFGGGSRLSGFVGVSGYWANLGEDATEDLRLTEPEELDPLSAAMGYSISAGFTVSP